MGINRHPGLVPNSMSLAAHLQGSPQMCTVSQTHTYDHMHTFACVQAYSCTSAVWTWIFLIPDCCLRF